MKEKKQLILRIPETLWDELNAMAADECRSINGQIEYLLTRAVRNKKTKKDIVSEQFIDEVAEKLIAAIIDRNEALQH